MRVPWGEGSRGVGVGAMGPCQGGGERGGRPRARLDSCLRRNDACRRPFDRLRANGLGGRTYDGEWGMRWGGDAPRPAPRPWVPAFAGNDGGGVRAGVGPAAAGRALREAPLRWGGVGSAGQSAVGCGGGEEGVPPPAPHPAGPAAPRSPFDFPQGERPPWPRRTLSVWVHAFAGMTRVGECGKDEGCRWRRAPFDRLRANGLGGRTYDGEWGMRWGGDAPRPAPRPWVPAFAGTTVGE